MPLSIPTLTRSYSCPEFTEPGFKQLSPAWFHEAQAARAQDIKDSKPIRREDIPPSANSSEPGLPDGTLKPRVDLDVVGLDVFEPEVQAMILAAHRDRVRGNPTALGDDVHVVDRTELFGAGAREFHGEQ